ncbi:hypothetical protein RQP46_011522 [Phenoliferia psychrophenolica]
MCGGGNFQPLGGLAYFYDGTALRNAGYRSSYQNALDTYHYARCEVYTDLDRSLYIKKNPVVLVHWADAVADIEAPLPAGAVSNPTGTCEGFAIDAGDGNANGVVGAAFSSGSNCTVTTTIIVGFVTGTGDSTSGSADSSTPFQFNTICNGNVYWNGAGYRTARNQNDYAGHSLTDTISTTLLNGRSTLAYFTADGSSSPAPVSTLYPDSGDTDFNSLGLFGGFVRWVFCYFEFDSVRTRFRSVVVCSAQRDCRAVEKRQLFWIVVALTLLSMGG